MSDQTDVNLAQLSTEEIDLWIRRRLFWTILSCALIALAFSHIWQWCLRQPLNAFDPGSGALITQGLPWKDFCTFGAYLAELSPRRPHHRAVLMFGNSVYQACGIVELMQQQAEQEEQQIDYFNLGLAGSGIHDHLVELAKFVKQKPDLVVISFINLAFSMDYCGCKDSMPRFRTDANQMVFDREVITTLPASFYQREFNLDETCGALVSTLFPVKRVEYILRYRARQKLGKIMPASTWFFQWTTHRKTVCPPHVSEEPNRLYPETVELLQELIAVAQRHQVPLLFLRQESGPIWGTPDVMPVLRRACESYDKAFVVDLGHFYDPVTYPDDVHPIPSGREFAARRHSRAIRDTLNHLRIPAKGDKYGL